MNEYMIFLEKEIIGSVAASFREKPDFIENELPALMGKNPIYFEFFKHFSDGEDRAASFNAATLTYLFFERQLQLLRERGKANIAAFPKIEKEVLDSFLKGPMQDNLWGRNVLRSLDAQNHYFLDFLIDYSAQAKQAEKVGRVFLFAYGLLAFQLDRTRETPFSVPENCLQ